MRRIGSMAGPAYAGTILVVDDEPEVRKLVAAMVARLGYLPLTAASGEQALTVYRNHKRPIALLIADVVAPGISGPALADQLAALQPGLKVLYISGYLDTQVVQKYVVEMGHALLNKPFSAEQMRNKLRELLGPAKLTRVPDSR